MGCHYLFALVVTSMNSHCPRDQTELDHFESFSEWGQAAFSKCKWAAGAGPETNPWLLSRAQWKSAATG